MANNRKPCPVCGKAMHRQSLQCRTCYKEERAMPEHYIVKHCPVCGDEFTVHITHINRGQGKYCSVSCARSGSPTKPKTRVIFSCDVCNSVMEKHLSEIRKNVNTGNYCSPDCWYKYNQRDNHYLWNGGQHERLCPEGREWRKLVIERDRGFCRLCHSQENLEAHHIERFGSNKERRWDVDNGVTLCSYCHKKFRGKEDEYASMFDLIASVQVVVWNV